MIECITFYVIIMSRIKHCAYVFNCYKVIIKIKWDDYGKKSMQGSRHRG